LPLCVDLDGTLAKTDLLSEAAINAFRKKWTCILQSAFWFFSRKARMKILPANITPPGPESLPYDEELIAFLKKEREGGRIIVLATSRDRSIADPISRHLNIFDEVIASDGVSPLEGEAKAKALVDRFGEGGFVYAGNRISDLPVWKKAKAAVLVNASNAVHRAVCGSIPVEREFHSRKPVVLELLRANRPYQWVKNLLVFIPTIAAHRLSEKAALFPTLIAFVAFCVAASGTYLINDLLDLEADRLHPRKRYRPFASGDLSLHYSLIGPLLIVAALGIALSVSTGVFLVLLSYVFLSLLYSTQMKKFPLVDVFSLTALYILRIIAGGVSSGSYASVWLLNFSGFLFLSLGFLKRYTEFSQSEADHPSEKNHRGYTKSDALLLNIMGVGSSFISSMVLGLYINSTQAYSAYRTPALLWGIVPLVLFWQSRMWLAANRGDMTDDPIIYAARDRFSILVAVFIVLIYILASADLDLGILTRR
jgi:4-hydroxybenzoate polyprenyltransferase